MGNVSLWTYSVILLCFGRVTFSQRCPYENSSSGYKNAPSKLNLRNFLGSKLVQRLADNYNGEPQYEPYDHQMYSPPPCEQQMGHPPPPAPPPPPSPPQPLPPPPLPCTFLRGMNSYQYDNPRMHTSALSSPPLPPGVGVPQNFGAPPNEMSSPPHVIDLPPPRAVIPPPPHSMGPPMELPRRGMNPPPQQVDQSNTQENYYTETVTTSCPSCGTCSECEASQDYTYQDEPCSCCSEGNCPCACEECPCSCGEKSCSCGGRCQMYSGGDSSYPAEKEYNDREQNYDEYPTSDCPCCCECSENQDCSCAYANEPQVQPHRGRERPSYRGYPPPPPLSPMNENYMEGPPNIQPQRNNENYVNMMGPPAYKSMPSPYREFQQSNYPQYEEPMGPPEYVKLPPRRAFIPQSLSQPEIPQPGIHHPPLAELSEEQIHHRLPHYHRIPEPQERIMQNPRMSEVPEKTMHRTEITERTVHRYQEPSPPMQMQPVEPYPVHQEMSRVNEWKPMPRMPPSGPPRHMMEDERPRPEPPVPIFRNYHPLPSRYGRKHRHPSKPPFFEGLNYSDGC